MCICEEVANNYLLLTPDEFDDWLANKASAEPGSDYALIRSGHLAGNLTYEWAQDHASADLLARG